MKAILKLFDINKADRYQKSVKIIINYYCKLIMTIN